MKKQKRFFSEDTKRQAVTEYVSGKKSAAAVAAEMNIQVGQLYRWKVEFDEAAKGARLEEIQSLGHNAEDAKRILDLETELAEYKMKVGEQAVIIDLLKKLQASKISPPESELTGLINTTKKSDRKRRQPK